MESLNRKTNKKTPTPWLCNNKKQNLRVAVKVKNICVLRICQREYLGTDCSQSCNLMERLAVLPTLLSPVWHKGSNSSMGWFKFSHILGMDTLSFTGKLQLATKTAPAEKEDLNSEIRVHFEWKKILNFYSKRFPRPVNLTHQPLSPQLQNFHRYLMV